MGMAAQGLKVAVLTIDPAKRLANSLGLPELGNEERLVDPERFAAHGIEMKGELWAMMLDAKRTFDDLVERHAPDEETRDRILQNRIYKEISNAMAGSQEYMAMEKLYELHQEARYDLLVLDTPPDAPRARLHRRARAHVAVHRGPLAAVLPEARPARREGARPLRAACCSRRSSASPASTCCRTCPSSSRASATWREGFSERAQRVKELLGHRDTTFLLVTAPAARGDRRGRLLLAPAEGGAPAVRRRGREQGPPRLRAAAGARRVRARRIGRRSSRRRSRELPVRARRSRSSDADLAARVYENFEHYRALAARDRENMARLTERLDEDCVLCVPYFDEDVHDIDGLAQVNRYLFSSSAERREMLERAGV